MNFRQAPVYYTARDASVTIQVCNREGTGGEGLDLRYFVVPKQDWCWQAYFDGGIAMADLRLFYWAPLLIVINERRNGSRSEERRVGKGVRL